MSVVEVSQFEEMKKYKTEEKRMKKGFFEHCVTCFVFTGDCFPFCSGQSGETRGCKYMSVAS